MVLTNHMTLALCAFAFGACATGSQATFTTTVYGHRISDTNNDRYRKLITPLRDPVELHAMATSSRCVRLCTAALTKNLRSTASRQLSKPIGRLNSTPSWTRVRKTRVVWSTLLFVSPVRMFHSLVLWSLIWLLVCVKSHGMAVS